MNESYRNKINPFLHSKVNFTKELKKVTLKPEQLLSAHRFDVIIKYLYLKYINSGLKVDWVKQMYIDHIGAFSNGKFCEGDFSGKNCVEKYLDAFIAIADSIKQHGFNEENSILPLSIENVIIDGAHRLAASLYYKSDVSCLLLEAKSPNYDFQYFKNRGMKAEFLDTAALEYTRLKPCSYILIVFPVANGKDSEINSIIENYGEIYYKKDVYFNKTGALNFVRQLYYGEPWAGDFKKGFSGEKHKVNQCFKKNMLLKAYFFEANSLEKVKECKKAIRALFDYGNDSAHATGGREETMRIAEQLLNNNSIYFFNNSTYIYNRELEDLLLNFKQWLSNNLYDKDNFCIDAGAVLNVYGIRGSQDLDFLHFGYRILETGHKGINSHQSEQVYYENSPEEIIFDPIKYFYYNGLKFTTLNVLRKMKLRRNEVKDRRDLVLIKRKLSKSFNFHHLLLSAFYKIVDEFQGFPNNIKFFVLRSSPPIFLPYLKATYSLLRKIKNGVYFPLEYFSPYERTRKYRGFTLFYTRRYSLVNRIRGNNIYEAKLSQRIIEELKRTGSEYFLDVGANIGLISLNVLREMPDAKIFCFEPGPHQSALLNKTINLNNLDRKIRLFKYALGDKTGEFQFATHYSLHTSGDGFFDTKRAGKCKFIKVGMDTLDNCWESTGNSFIKVVKIDVEGAELLVLKGGSKFIKRCRPTIFLEINKYNLKPYPYCAQDILKYFLGIQYNLRSLDGALITNNNLNYYLNKTDLYVAGPELI